ncbi:hypothetical protein TNCV_3006781 [Trichonephila clavipes]|nr:hypothetical protein TNCV_3006781 [Trichonephila clavipes]
MRFTCVASCDTWTSTVDLVERIRQLFPHLDLRDFPSLEPYAYLEPADLFHDYLEQEARKGKGAFIQAVWTVIGKPKLYNLGNQGVDSAGSTDFSLLDSIGSNGVGRVLWAEMAQYRVSSARCMPHLPHSYTQTRKNAVWTCVSQKVPFTTLGHSQHLQSIVYRPINTMLSPRKMGE